MSQIRLRIVGESVIEVVDRRITPTSPQLFALLLYLSREHDREVARTELIDLLYPASDPIGDSSHRLRQSLYKLRGLGAPIAFGNGTIRIEGKHVHSDVTELLSGSWEVRRERLTRSFEILPHYAPPADTSLCEWVEQLREKLHNALRQHLTRDMEVARRKADWRYLEAIARRTAELDPLNESAVLALAEATAHSGSKARAVSILDAYRSELGEERASLTLPASLLQKRIEASDGRALQARHAPFPLIGRERELEYLLSHWQSARRGAAHLLWLTGNKSVGKSRIAEELAASVIMSGSGQVVAFSISPMDSDRPLSFIAALANRLSSLPGAAGCDPVSLQALGRLSGSISIPSSVNPEHVNSLYSESAIRNAVCDLIGCVCDERPVIVIVDDAQHLDTASKQLLDTISSRVPNKRLFIVLCGTAEPEPTDNRRSVLHLEPLSTEASERLWQEMLGAQDLTLSDDVSQKCLDTAAGTPGHMELLAQQAARDSEQFLIPVDLIALADRRLSQLPLHARYTLEATVILGDAATTNGVAHLTGLTTYELLSALHTLESTDLVVSSNAGLRCRSGLIAERVRATSSTTVMSMMEGRAAEYFEEEQSGELWSPSMAWRIASHWQRAGEPRRARTYLRACWQHAVSVGQPAKASAAINDALAIATDPVDRASLLDDLIGTQQAAGDLAAVIFVVNERRSLGSRVHDSTERSAQLIFDEDEASVLKNSNPAAHVDAIRAHLESSLLDPHRRVRAARLLMMAADANLDAGLARYTIERCLKLTPENSHSALLLSHVSLIYHTIFGDPVEALRIADDIQEQAKKLERSWYTITSERNCAFARQLAAPGPSDYESFERAFAQAIDASMIPLALGHAGSLISVLIDDGELYRAQEWMATAERLADQVDSHDFAIDYLGAQVDLSLLTGNHKKATRYVEAMERCAPRYQSKRSRNDLVIYRLRVQQFVGSPWAPEAHVEQLLHYHEAGKRLTRHDDHMDVLWHTLNAVGEPGRASALLADYLANHRRERRPCRHILRLRTRSDPAWENVKLSVSVSAKAAV